MRSSPSRSPSTRKRMLSTAPSLLRPTSQLQDAGTADVSGRPPAQTRPKQLNKTSRASQVSPNVVVHRSDPASSTAGSVARFVALCPAGDCYLTGESDGAHVAIDRPAGRCGASMTKYLIKASYNAEGVSSLV